MARSSPSLLEHVRVNRDYACGQYEAQHAERFERIDLETVDVDHEYRRGEQSDIGHADPGDDDWDRIRDICQRRAQKFDGAGLDAGQTGNLIDCWPPFLQ